MALGWRMAAMSDGRVRVYAPKSICNLMIPSFALVYFFPLSWRLLTSDVSRSRWRVASSSPTSSALAETANCIIPESSVSIFTRVTVLVVVAAATTVIFCETCMYSTRCNSIYLSILIIGLAPTIPTLFSSRRNNSRER